MTNSTKSNTGSVHLFPELPPTRDSLPVGGGPGKAGRAYEFGASWLLRVFSGVVAAAVRDLGQPLLRLPVLEFTAIMVMFAMLLFSLG